MKKSDISKIKKQLDKLALRVIQLVKRSVSEKNLVPTRDPYFRWVLDKFEYTDEGITMPRAHGEYLTKKSWIQAIINLEKIIKAFPEYKTLLKQLKLHLKDRNIENIISQFTGKIINSYLDTQKMDKRQVSSFISIFLKELEGKPVKYCVEVELYGVVLHSDLIKIKSSLSLRKVKKEDFEKEFRVSFPFNSPQLFGQKHTAVLNIEFLGNHGSESQKKVEKAITLLRLFKVGSVKYKSYRMFSESIINTMGSGTITSSVREISLEKYLISQKDEEKLKKFWRLLNKYLPENFFYPPTQVVDYKNIAYSRYSDALLQNGVIERRIANAIMGLEALYLEETMELSYKLRVRISKLLELLNYNPIETRDSIRDAYSVRSTFAHGAQLKAKDKKKLIERYGDIKTLLLQILDYLRISIIIMLFCKKEKQEFIRLIDDSLIDKKREVELRNTVLKLKLWVSHLGGETLRSPRDLTK